MFKLSFKILLLSLNLFSLFFTAACSTPAMQEIDLAKLKGDERAYEGNIQVDLNGKKNPDLTCDLFLNSDINPMIRISPDGDFVFKSIKKKLAFSKIACIYQVKNEKKWIIHSLDIPRIAQTPENLRNQVFNMGSLKINWNVSDTDLNKDPNGIFNSEDPTRDIGKIEINPGDAEKPPSPQI